MEYLNGFNLKKILQVLGRVLLFILAYLILGGGLQFVAVLLTDNQPVNISSPEDFSDQLTSFQHLIISAFDLLAVATITVYFLRIEAIPWRSIGLRFNVKQAVQGFILGGIFIALVFFIFILTDQVEVKQAPFNLRELGIISVFLFLAALSEELMFRAYFMNMMEKHLNKFWSIILSSILFSLFHIFNPNLSLIAMIEIFAAGVVMAYAYAQTKSIWFVTVLHFSWNYAQTMLGFNVSGQDFYSLYDFTMLKQNIITGGDFGFEGSIVSILVAIITFFILTQYKPKRQ